MVNWIPLDNPHTLEVIIESSLQVPCVIFKHSTRCSISALAKHRFESSWNFDEAEIKPYFLDILAHRRISDQLVDTFDVPHESPQLLLIQDGKCTYHASHLDIDLRALQDCFEDMI